jgi:sulfoquinovosidase
MSEFAGSSRFTISESGGQITAATPALQVVVTRDPFALSIADATGDPILAPLRGDVSLPSGSGEHGPNASFDSATRYLGLTYGIDGTRLGSYNGSGRAPRWYTLTAVEHWQQDGNRVSIGVGTDDIVGRTAQVTIEFLADAVVRVRLTFDRDAGLGEVGIAFAADPDEGYFGLGERFARTNHRGHEVLNWIEDAYVDPRPGHDWTYWPVPFFLSSRGYGVLLDTTRRAIFRMTSDRDDAWQASVDGSELDVVVFGGPRPVDVIRQFTALTGRPPLPQPWAFGVWKTTLSGADAVREEARRLREDDLGVSALWVYDQFEPETNSGWNSAMGYPEGEYPDMPGLVRELHDDGFKVLGYLNTQFIVGRPRTDEGIAKGYFLKQPDGETYLVPGPDPNPDVGIRFGTMALYDPTHPEGVPWWQEMLRRMLVETGYDGWMHDFGEYTPRDAVFADGRTGEEIRNLYPTLYQRTAAEICREAKPDFAFFVRSGYIGSNQWAPAAWPADQHTDWSPDRGLPSIIPAALSVGICGTNTWGPDIGGFFDAYDGGDIATSTELWIRWCQLGALTPLMRDHLGPKRMTTPDAVDMWSDAQTVDTWRRYARLHNALAAYLYAYATIAHESGVPTMRHMVLRYPDEPEALRQDHQYLLGDELLVAPVIEPGATTRRVWFPPGTWYGFWDDAAFTGPGYFEVPAPIEQIPLFVRGGSLLPLIGKPIVTLAGVAPDDLLTDLELRLYPGGDPDASADFVFHDGSVVQYHDAEDHLTLAFDAQSRARQYTVRVPAAFGVSEMLADGRALPRGAERKGAPGWWRDPEDNATWATLPAGAGTVTVRYRGIGG